MVGLRLSNDNEYIMKIEGLDIEESIVNIRLSRTSNAEKVADIVAKGDLVNSDYFGIAVSDDGKRIASIVFDKYEKSHVYVYDDGKEVLCLDDYPEVSRVDFKDNDHLMFGNRNKYYILDLSTQLIQVEKENCYGLKNPYGDDIAWVNDTQIVVGGKEINCSSFSYVDVIGIEGAVVASEVGKRAICYDLEGNKLWESDNDPYGHIISMIYDSTNKMIYGEGMIPTGGNFILEIDAATGKVIKAHDVTGCRGKLGKVGNELHLFRYDGRISKITAQGIIDTSYRLKGIKDEVKEYIAEHKASQAKALIFEDYEGFLKMLYDRNYKISKIIWHEFCKQGEQQIGFWACIEKEDSDYIWAETDINEKFSKRKTLEDILKYISKTKKKYAQYCLYPEFFINNF